MKRDVCIKWMLFFKVHSWILDKTHSYLFSSSCCWLWLLNFDSERKEKILSASLTGCNFTVGEFSCQLVVILYFWRLQFFNEEMSGYHREVLGEERGKGFIGFFFSLFLSCLQIYIGEKNNKKKKAKMGHGGTIAIVLWISFKTVKSFQDVGVFQIRKRWD